MNQYTLHSYIAAKNGKGRRDGPAGFELEEGMATTHLAFLAVMVVIVVIGAWAGSLES